MVSRAQLLKKHGFSVPLIDLRAHGETPGSGAPVLIVAGAADEHTTLQESQKLYAAAANPKGLWVVPLAHHQDFLAYRPADMRHTSFHS
jgi:alpha-beta hydrolase superfamily lysophospholipase